MSDTPTLLLDPKIAAANLDRMLARAARHGLHFRPHFKTPQSLAVGQMYRERGVRAITVSSVRMAEYFAGGGWDDITVAFPANVREAAAIDRLAEQIKLNLLVVNIETVKMLAQRLKNRVGVFLKIDVGTHRTGIQPDDERAIAGLTAAISAAPNLDFRGFLAHAGHSYAARSMEEVLAVHHASTDVLRKLKKQYAEKYPGLLVSTGDTPTCSRAGWWEGIDEIRPGNFIFYDLMQVQIGSCRREDIAVALACPVVAKHPERQEVVVYGGGIHLSKDRIVVSHKNWGGSVEGKTIFGQPVLLTDDGWEMPGPDCFVRSLSQEHGVIRCSPSFFEDLKIGGLVGILPVHSCMAVDLMREFVTLGGERMGCLGF